MAARLVAKGCSQKYGIDYDEVFSPIERQTSFRFLIALAMNNGYHTNKTDRCVYFDHDRSIILAVYVDDHLFSWKRRAGMLKLEKVLYGEFKMKDLAVAHNWAQDYIWRRWFNLFGSVQAHM